MAVRADDLVVDKAYYKLGWSAVSKEQEQDPQFVVLTLRFLGGKNGRYNFAVWKTYPPWQKGEKPEGIAMFPTNEGTGEPLEFDYLYSVDDLAKAIQEHTADDDEEPTH